MNARDILLRRSKKIYIASADQSAVANLLQTPAAKQVMEASGVDPVKAMLTPAMAFLAQSVGGFGLESTATFVANLAALGYAATSEVLTMLQLMPKEKTEEVCLDVLNSLKEMVGERDYASRVFYPNFPQQVMEASEAELYFNAVLHYLSAWVSDLKHDPDFIWLPQYTKKQRPQAADKIKLKPLTLGSEADLQQVAERLATSNTSISDTDKSDLRWLIKHRYLKTSVHFPNKENLAFVGALLTHVPEVMGQFRTATDILRLAVAFKDGDVSLATKEPFKKLPRSKRRLILSLLDKVNPSMAAEDVRRWPGRWKDLASILHPGEFSKQYPNAFQVLHGLRNRERVALFGGKVRKAIDAKDVKTALGLLESRPGELARRLDVLLRVTVDAADKNEVLKSFALVALKVSTPVLLQVMNHFDNRNSRKTSLRVFFPKGNVSKLAADEKLLPRIKSAYTNQVVSICEKALRDRFAKLPPLGNTYVDPKLQDYLVPFSQRSASKSLRTLVRGSQVDLAKDKNIARFFIWWKQPKGTRVDIDLSAIFYNEEWRQIDSVTYYALRGHQLQGAAVHSGDITSAPDGACEFIDADLTALRNQGIRYIVMVMQGFNLVPFCDLPECFAGWMSRTDSMSGEIFDARTVEDKADIATNATAVTPLVIDVSTRKVIWMDMAFTHHSRRSNNARNNAETIVLQTRAFTELKRPNLYTLLRLHAEARGSLTTLAKAETVFSVKTGTQYDIATIASQYMANEVEPLPVYKRVSATMNLVASAQ
jgi:hypothetical protein